MKKIIIIFILPTLLLAQNLRLTNFNHSGIGGRIYDNEEFGQTKNLLFVEHPGLNNGNYSIWITDGTIDGTKLITDTFPPNTNIGKKFQTLGVVNNRCIFLMEGDVTGLQLWSTDGTKEGTIQLTNYPISQGGIGQYLPNKGTVINDTMYFNQANPFTTKVLFKTDGTLLGTSKIVNFGSGGDNTVLYSFVYNNELYSFVKLNFSDLKLVKVDLINKTFQDFLTLPGINNIHDFEVIGQKLFFLNNYNKIYIVDLITKTFNIKSITKGQLTEINKINPKLYNLKYFSVFNNKLYFNVRIVSTGNEMWHSDGTISGTISLKSFADDTPSPIGQLAIDDNNIYFMAVDNSNKGLWKMDKSEKFTFLKNGGWDTENLENPTIILSNNKVVTRANFDSPTFPNTNNYIFDVINNEVTLVTDDTKNDAGLSTYGFFIPKDSSSFYYQMLSDTAGYLLYIFNHKTVSVENIPFNSKLNFIQVSPNPVRNFIKFDESKFSSDFIYGEKLYYKIYNINSIKEQGGIIEGIHDKINIESLIPGNYYLECKTKNGFAFYSPFIKL